MPIYEYACPKCDHRSDHLLPIDHDAPKCDKCGAEMVKQISAHAATSQWGSWRR